MPNLLFHIQKKKKKKTDGPSNIPVYSRALLATILSWLITL